MRQPPPKPPLQPLPPLPDAYFKHRCVQDLAWVIQSPPLISGRTNDTDWWGSRFFAQEYQDCFAALKQLDLDPTPLIQKLESAKSKRLGHYFEALIAYWITLSPNYVLLLQNHQLRTTGDKIKTLGEIDFLIREMATGKLIHLEVSVKFYLGTADTNDMANWHGPGLQDRLDRKYHHLCTHQTQLSRKYPELIPHRIDETACLIKGRLFYPPNTQCHTRFTSKDHLAGYWYQLSATPDTARTYWQLGKRNWLAPIHPKADESGLTTAVLPDSLAEPCLYAAHENNAETERFFLLPQDFWQRL